MIYQVIFSILITSSIAQTYVGTVACSGLGSGACTVSAISGIGYCYWDTACQTLPCYMIDEVAACRAGSGLPTGGASTLCDSLETFSLQYDNVCCDKSEGKLNYAFVRFSKTTDGSATQTSDAVTIGTLTVSDSTTMFKLYTINPWLVDKTSVANFQSQLQAILLKYRNSAATLIAQSDSHPFYLERTVYQSLQMLRDIIVLQTSSQTSLRDTLLPNIWSVALIALFRMTKFQPNYYQTNYYFVNFAIIPYSRLQLTVNGQLHSTFLDWSSYSYTSNGFVMVYSFPPEQFGIRNAYSDVLCIRPITSTASYTYAAPEAVFDSAFILKQIIWYWTDTALTVVAANLKLYSFPISTAVEATIAQVSGVTFTCDLAAKKCTSTIMTGTLPNTGVNYYISTGLGVAADKTKVQCRLQTVWGTQCS